MTLMPPQEYRKTKFIHRVGLVANRPAAADVLVGTLYFSTDTGFLERSNGLSWELFASSGGGGGTLTPHHATHEPGGSDEIPSAAWITESNIFDGDQTIDGDLFVTGTIVPITQAQLDKINQLIGDPTGSRMLMSSNYISGLSLRHDENLALGRISCGNYDTQTYQPLIIESESLQFKTGISPVLNEHVKIHPSGGITVGTDHSVDPGVGVVKATEFIPTIQGPVGPQGPPGSSNAVAHHITHETGGSDQIVSLPASVITSGAIASARLDPNIAYGNVANIFVQDQKISKSIPAFFLNDSSQPSGARQFRIINAGGGLYFQPVDDGGTVASGYLVVNRSGDLSTTGVFYERNRTVPLGEWQNEPFNAANFTANVNTWIVNTVTGNAYVLIGKTLIWGISISDSTVGTGNTVLLIKLPGGLTTPAASGSFIVKPGYVFNNGAVQLDFAVQVQDATHVAIHRGGPVIIAGQFQAYFTMTMAVN